MTIITKPWGFEELLEHNSRYVLKRLVMKKGFRCSLQYHREKTETIFVVSGKLSILIQIPDSDSSDDVYLPGSSVTILPGVIHRMSAIEDCEYLEASTPELSDVVRISDDFQRN